MDNSNGYEENAHKFLQIRENSKIQYGSETVGIWANKFNKNASILDLGCGSGNPISKTLIEKGFMVTGIDASAKMIAEFEINFPKNACKCESVEESDFFNSKFDGIIAWGLMFLVKEDVQKSLIEKISRHLNETGLFFFTAPFQNVMWSDAITGLDSVALGAKEYHTVLNTNGFEIFDSFVDAGGNYYYSAQKRMN